MRGIISKLVRKLQACCKKLFSIPIEKRYNIISIKPTYKIVNRLNQQSIVVDLGTGEDADFSQELIERYGLKAYGFEPTLKHHSALDTVVKKTKGSFMYYGYALSDTRGVKGFFESSENVSGSLFSSHINIKHDTIRSYDVETITLDTIFDILHIDHIDLLKMDIEGAEYSVLSSLSVDTLRKIDQMIVEFHHDSIDLFDANCTFQIIQILKKAGFVSHTTDYVNYLFFRPSLSSKDLAKTENTIC